MGVIDTDEFYRDSCAANFVKVADIARNKAWTTQTAWGDLQITINLSKPEKDPRAIAAAATQQTRDVYVDPATGFERPCPLCVTQADVDAQATIENVATATAKDPGDDPVDPDEPTPVPVDPEEKDPSYTVVKTVTSEGSAEGGKYKAG